MLARLAFLFIVVPMVDLALLLLLAQATNWVFTLVLAIGTGLLGAVLAKREGFAALRRMRQDLREGRMPGKSALDAVLVLIAATLLAAPGLLTDFVGLSLLFPPTRRRYRAWLSDWLKSRFHLSLFTSSGRRSGDVIDSFVVDREGPVSDERSLRRDEP